MPGESGSSSSWSLNPDLFPLGLSKGLVGHTRVWKLTRFSLPLKAPLRRLDFFGEAGVVDVIAIGKIPPGLCDSYLYLLAATTSVSGCIGDRVYGGKAVGLGVALAGVTGNARFLGRSMKDFGVGLEDRLSVGVLGWLGLVEGVLWLEIQIPSICTPPSSALAPNGISSFFSMGYNSASSSF